MLACKLSLNGGSGNFGLDCRKNCCLDVTFNEEESGHECGVRPPRYMAAAQDLCMYACVRACVRAGAHTNTCSAHLWCRPNHYFRPTTSLSMADHTTIYAGLWLSWSAGHITIRAGLTTIHHFASDDTNGCMSWQVRSDLY